MTTVPHGQTPGNRLVIFAPNWLGDAVMALPAVADVCRSGRHDSILIAAKPSIAPLFTLLDGITGVLDTSSVDLQQQGFEAALLLPNSFRSAMIAWQARIPERMGYRTQGRGPLLTQAVSPGVRGHQAAYYRHLVGQLDYPAGPSQPTLQLSPSIRSSGADLLARAGWNRESALVAFAPGAANGRAKQWSPASFAAVARELAADRVDTVLLGTPADVAVGDEIVSALGARADGRVLNLIGRTNLIELSSVLVHCRALVCNDSGAMHLAAALGVNVAAIFGPSNERETRPLGGGISTVLTHEVWCRPCMLRECPLDHRCMTGVTVDAVLGATTGLLRERRT